MSKLVAVTVFSCVLVGSLPGFAGDEHRWERVQLDARFRSEGAAAADFNNDGLVDVVAGDFWYEAPHWTRHEIRPAGSYWAGNGYSNSFCNWTWDINGDGWNDIILVGFPGAPFHWYENPKGKEGHWREHVIWHSICNETPLFTDVTGDGKPDIVCGSQPEAQMGYLEIPEGDAVYSKWDFVPISEPGDPATNGTFKYYHGLGATDVNGDGRRDITICHGFWEAPKELDGSAWTFHPGLLREPGGDSVVKTADLYAVDLDLDGDQDLLGSSAHAFGIWWFENQGEQDGTVTYASHLIDESLSQTHALWFGDIDNDDDLELVTGKRYFAHNGGDPGGLDPVKMIIVDVTPAKGGPQFSLREIRAGRDTGIGTQFSVVDVDRNGLLDLVLSNKKGVNLLLQHAE